MNIFNYRNHLIEDYKSYIKSFISIKDDKINSYIDKELESGLLWPEPLIQLNPSFQKGKSIDQLVAENILHKDCARIFRIKNNQDDLGKLLQLHKHQEDAIRVADSKESYVLTTGTGSGKSLTYIIPIVNNILKSGSGKGIKAIIVYPMNALANSQEGELNKFIKFGFPEGSELITFAKYTGPTDEATRAKIIANPPDILLTNFVMLELILTRTEEKKLRDAAKGLKFLVLDELHTYRGRQGADVALLVRRLRNLFSDDKLQCIGTSATLSSSGTQDDQKKEIAKVASLIFGTKIKKENVITETLEYITNVKLANEENFLSDLKGSIKNINSELPDSFDYFIKHPLAIWLEINLGIDKTAEEFRRSIPKRILGDSGLAAKLSSETAIDINECKNAIEKILLLGYSLKNPITNFSSFAFKLHQFISKGDTVYATVESEEKRYLTISGQYYSPEDESKILLPLAFCRECGKEYYSVYLTESELESNHVFEPRNLRDQISSDKKKAGFIYLDTIYSLAG